MRNTTVHVLRLVIALALAGSVICQVGLLPLIWWDLDGAHVGIRIAVVGLLLLGIVALQVVAVCIWRLLTMVRRGTVFSFAAFRYVDVIVGAVAAGAVLMFALATVAAISNHLSPGDELAPGMIALMCGASLVIAGVALVIVVLRTLLAQAVALDAEARHLQSELDGVI